MSSRTHEPGDDTVHVVVTCRNAEPWVESCIASLRGQSLRRFSCVLVDDASTDGTRDAMRRAMDDDARFRLVELPTRVWPTQARMIGLQNLENARPHEIVVLVDGDDWLYDGDALAVIRATHHRRRLLVTYGNYVRTDGQPHVNAEYPLRVKLEGTFREYTWLASPPRSFRFGLWTHVAPSFLRDPGGRFYHLATDRALFLPLLELAGVRSGFIRRPLYIYNYRPPVSAAQAREEDAASERVVREIHARPGHARLPESEARSLLGVSALPDRHGSGDADHP